MMLLDEKLVIAIVIISLITFSTRALPFLVFGGEKKKVPDIINYYGRYLPPAIICVILVYSFKDTNVLAFPFAIREIIAVAVVVLLQLWRKNTMLSIFAGTIVYMLLVKFIS